MIIQKQNWSEYTRYLIVHEYGSVFLDSYPEVQESFGGTAYIWGLFVFPNDRRKGIGELLLDQAEYLASRALHKSVVLEWNQKDTPREILEWYKRRGYVVIGHYRDEQYTLEKKL